MNERTMHERTRRAALTINPVLVREVRARWRGWQAFILLFSYAVLFAAAMGLLYAISTDTNTYYNAGPAAQAKRLGRDLLQHLTWIQTLGWILIAPALTATSIAGERERGLLEALQLSGLTPWRIVSGKLLSAFSLIFLLLLVPLPITALCFMMGGVSGGEFLQVFALHFVTALTGAAIGLFCSAWHRRASIALRSMIIFLLVWHLGSWFAVYVSFALLAARPAPTAATAAAAGIDWSFICLLFSQANPMFAAVALFDYFGAGLPMGATISSLRPPFDSPWAISITFQLLLTVLLLWLATRAVRRPLRETYWLERKRKPQAAKAKATARQGVITGRREVPLARLFHFSNPVLRRETHAKFRLRRSSNVTIVFEVLLSLFIIYLYLLSMWWIVTDRVEGKSIWQGVTGIGLITIMLVTAMMGAGSFTREREAGTWEAIRLSLLSPTQVIAGKLLAPLLACVGYSLIAWPLILACMTDLSTHGSTTTRITPGEVIGTALILGATAFCYTAWGMFFSWRCRRTISAVSWTLATLFFAVVFVPTGIDMLALHGSTSLSKLVELLHPLIAISKLNNPPDQSSALRSGLESAAALMALGSGILVVLYASMRRQVRH